MEFILEAVFNAPATTIYETWLSSEGHSKMTGGDAKHSNQIGDEFTTWDGYISGKNLELIPGKLIRQSWRTTEFEAGQADSTVEITFTAIEKGKTLVSIKHTGLNDPDIKYKQGWADFYFTPMEEYFSART